MDAHAKKMHCGHCGEEATQRCGHCKNVHYCAPECQQADWRFHKVLCKQFSAFQERPNDKVRRVILLPEKDNKPVFIWAPVEQSAFRCRDVLGDTQAEALLADGYGGSARLLDHSISLVHRDYFMEAGPNACLAALVGKELAQRWRGPLLITAAEKNQQLDPFRRVDIDTSSFTIALDTLREFSQRLAHGPPWNAQPTPPKKIEGMKINSTAPYIQSVNVPLRHPICKTGELFPILVRTKLPLRGYKCPAPSTPAPNTNEQDPALTDAALLRLCVDPNDPNFGQPPARFHDPDGASVLLIKTNKRDFTLQEYESRIYTLKNEHAPEMQSFPVEGRVECMRGLQRKWDSWNAIYEAMGGPAPTF